MTKEKQRSLLPCDLLLRKKLKWQQRTSKGMHEENKIKTKIDLYYCP